MAENCSKYLAKGRSVMVEGRLQTRAWEDKQGNKRYTTEIVATNVQFVGGGRKDGEAQGGGNAGGSGWGSGWGGESEGGFGGDDMGDIPF